MASNPVQGQGIVGRTKPTIRGNLGTYNKSTKVLSNTTVAFSGSNEGAAFLVENNGTIYDIGVKKVTIAATGVIYVLQ